MHLQTSVNGWDKALVKMPDYSLLKSVNDLGVLLDGLNKWVAAGRNPNRLYLCHRYHDYLYPDWEGWANNFTWQEWKEFWRTNFAKTIDETYYEQYASIITLVEELNEYTDTRMVTNKELLRPRIASARAAVQIWNTEYRGQRGIPNNARLVICNNPVGNDIPIEYFQLCRNEDAVLGTHLYTRWENGQRDSQDFRYHSGRTFYNEEQYGIKVDYVMGETGPYKGVLEGWRHKDVMNASFERLMTGMQAWWTDLRGTAAYKEGRILGPGAWFTSSRLNDQWDYYRLWESELIPLAEAAMQIWKPGTSPPPPPPDNFKKKAWEVTSNMQKTGQDGIRLNTKAGIQEQIIADNVYGHYDLQIVTAETIIDGKTVQAAESLTGKVPRRVYVWEAGESIWWYEYR
jgi:hypothetical protein